MRILLSIIAEQNTAGNPFVRSHHCFVAQSEKMSSRSFDISQEVSNCVCIMLRRWRMWFRASTVPNQSQSFRRGVRV